MPSANPKLEKQASTEALDPIRQVITVVEHKIRNLEKRKGRLQQYRDIVNQGGDLSAEQKTAVAKYDEVAQTLEITRELHKQIATIANDHAKQQKKLARKEALERMQQDIAKVREVLLIQNALINLGTTAIREDFVNGSNGAIKLAEEEFKFLDDLYNEVKQERSENEPNFIQQAQKIAEHFVLLVDGKQREIVGTTYSKLKEIITTVNQCGYFDQAQQQVLSVEQVVEEVTQSVAEVQINNTEPQQQEEFGETVRQHIPTQIQPLAEPTIMPFPVPVAVVSGAAGPIPVVAQPILPISQAAPTDPSFFSVNATFVPTTQVPQPPPQQQPTQPPRINEVIPPSSSFFFLQDSELDPPEAIVSQASNASAPQTVVSHIPPPATVVAAASLNAPIPTQTFTNQSFAAHVVPTPIMYPTLQPPQELTPRLPSFGSANPPPPIPMPPSIPTSIIPTSMQFTPQSTNSYPQSQTFEQMAQNESSVQKDELHEKQQINDIGTGEGDVGQNNGPTDWSAMSDGAGGDWGAQVEQENPSNTDLNQMQNSQQAWGNVSGDQQRTGGGFRGRGGRRGNSNGYGNRGRGGYQQNGRTPYYRNNDGNSGNNSYQNGYQRNWNSNSDNNGGGYNGGFKRSSSNPPRGGGGQRGDRERTSMDGNRGGGRGGSGQFRGNSRGGPRTNYAPRPKTQQMQN